MTLFYLLLLLVCLLDGVRMIFNKLFVNRYGSQLSSALWFAFLACGAFFIAMTVYNAILGQGMAFSTPSFLLALAFAAVNVLCTVVGFATLAIGNISTYTLVLQLGGMIIPFVYGLFIGEGMTIGKGVCMVLILTALLLDMQKASAPADGHASRRALLYYACLFSLNGAACIVLSLNQKALPLEEGGWAVDATSFTLWYMLLTSVLSLLAFLILRIKRRKDENAPAHGLDFAYAAGYGIFYGVANLLIAVCLARLDASMQFPFLTGGSIIISGLVGALFFKEPFTRRFALVAALVLVGTLFLVPWETILV